MSLFRKLFIWGESSGITADVERNTDDTDNLDAKAGVVANSILYARLDADTVVPIRADASTHSIQVIDYAHHEVHGGSAYYYKDFYTLAKAGTKDHLLITPDTNKWGHFVYDIEATSSEVRIYIYEGTVTSVDGTLETVRNRNRNIGDNNTILLYEDPSVTTVGTEIKAQTIGAGKNSDGGQNRDSLEIILKQNTKYLIRVTEGNVAATNVNMRLDWYEHTDKD